MDYSPSRTDQGYENSFDLLRSAGSRLDYEQFLVLWSEVSARFDAVAEQTHREFSMIELGRAFLAEAVDAPSEGLVRDFVRLYLADWNQGVIDLDGIQSLLEDLSQGFTLAIITNTHDPSLVPGHLQRLGVATLFRRVVTSVECGVRKPAAGIFRHALCLLDVEPEQCVYVGDTYEADYCGAKAAGIRPLLIDGQRKAPVPDVARLGSVFELRTVAFVP